LDSVATGVAQGIDNLFTKALIFNDSLFLHADLILPKKSAANSVYLRQIVQPN
jgi:hypothetical protein